MDERVKQLLKELGEAINESISGSVEVNDRIQRIRDEGYNLYVVLDATIGLDREDGEEESESAVKTQISSPKVPREKIKTDIQFRINVQDLAFLRSLGIDPTRKVKAPKRLEGRTLSDTDQQS